MTLESIEAQFNKMLQAMRAEVEAKDKTKGKLKSDF
jgi:hypothetical protein